MRNPHYPNASHSCSQEYYWTSHRSSKGLRLGVITEDDSGLVVVALNDGCLPVERMFLFRLAVIRSVNSSLFR